MVDRLASIPVRWPWYFAGDGMPVRLRRFTAAILINGFTSPDIKKKPPLRRLFYLEMLP